MWLMLQQSAPEDFVIATGVAHSVREFVVEAFKCVGKKILWEGKGVEGGGQRGREQCHSNQGQSEVLPPDRSGTLPTAL